MNTIYNIEKMSVKNTMARKSRIMEKRRVTENKIEFIFKITMKKEHIDLFTSRTPVSNITKLLFSISY